MPIDPITASLLISGGTTVLGGLLGAKSAADNNEEARRRDKINAELAANDAMFKAFGGGKSDKMAQMDQKSVLGGGLSGGLSGFLQGQNINSAINQDNAYKALLERLKAGDTAVTVGANPFGQDVGDINTAVRPLPGLGR